MLSYCTILGAIIVLPKKPAPSNAVSTNNQFYSLLRTLAQIRTLISRSNQKRSLRTNATQIIPLIRRSAHFQLQTQTKGQKKGFRGVWRDRAICDA